MTRFYVTTSNSHWKSLFVAIVVLYSNLLQANAQTTAVPVSLPLIQEISFQELRKTAKPAKVLFLSIVSPDMQQQIEKIKKKEAENVNSVNLQKQILDDVILKSMQADSVLLTEAKENLFVLYCLRVQGDQCAVKPESTDQFPNYGFYYQKGTDTKKEYIISDSKSKAECEEKINLQCTKDCQATKEELVSNCTKDCQKSKKDNCPILKTALADSHIWSGSRQDAERLAATNTATFNIQLTNPKAVLIDAEWKDERLRFLQVSYLKGNNFEYSVYHSNGAIALKEFISQIEKEKEPTKITYWPQTYSNDSLVFPDIVTFSSTKRFMRRRIPAGSNLNIAAEADDFLGNSPVLRVDAPFGSSDFRIEPKRSQPTLTTSNKYAYLYGTIVPNVVGGILAALSFPRLMEEGQCNLAVEYACAGRIHNPWQNWLIGVSAGALLVVPTIARWTQLIRYWTRSGQSL